eukprot:2107575-Amphidinium_carterae.1
MACARHSLCYLYHICDVGHIHRGRNKAAMHACTRGWQCPVASLIVTSHVSLRENKTFLLPEGADGDT